MYRICAQGLKGLKVVEGVFNALNDNEKLVVVIGKDSNVINDYSREINEFCKCNNIKAISSIVEAKDTYEYTFAAGWQRIISDVPYDTIIVFHDSLLPKYRGFNPLVTSLINGDSIIGVTVLLAEKTYDTGPIITQVKKQISYPITIEEAINVVSELYFNAAKDLVFMIEGNNLRFVKQVEEDATYSLWRDSKDYSIDWSKSSKEIERFVDAVGFPYDGAKTYVDNTAYTIEKVTVLQDLLVENRDVGKIIFFENEMPVVVCGEGLMRIDIIKNQTGQLIQKFNFRTRFVHDSL